jgi:hypothetical protein
MRSLRWLGALLLVVLLATEFNTFTFRALVDHLVVGEYIVGAGMAGALTVFGVYVLTQRKRIGRPHNLMDYGSDANPEYVQAQSLPTEWTAPV